MSQFFDCSDPARRVQGIDAACRAVAAGQLVVMPTDTVYGLGADAFDKAAVAALLAAKGRGRDMPVPVLVGSWSTIEGLMTYVPTQVRALIEAFWPGGLTLIVEQAPSLAWDLGDTTGTVAVRMPAHPLALQILDRTGPMAVSSANRSGYPPAPTAAGAREQLGEAVEVYLEVGDPGQGEPALPSTIIDTTASPPRVVRSGALDPDQLRAVLPDLQV